MRPVPLVLAAALALLACTVHAADVIGPSEQQPTN